jgi:hypothetical protein
MTRNEARQALYAMLDQANELTTDQQTAIRTAAIEFAHAAAMEAIQDAVRGFTETMNASRERADNLKRSIFAGSKVR